MSVKMPEQPKTESCEQGKFCPICKALGKNETLKEITGLEEVSRNPQAEKGIPRVVDCTAGCRYGLEPYFSPKGNGTYSYMLLRSERNPEAVVNHYWFDPACIERAK
jgi:hypothetical protein